MTYPRSCAHTWSNMGPKVSIQQNEAEYLEYLDSENLGVRYVLHAKGPLTTFGNGTEWDVLSHTTNGLALWTPVIFLSWNFMTKPEGANCHFAEICTHYKSTLRCAVCECVPYTGGRHDKKHYTVTRIERAPLSSNGRDITANIFRWMHLRFNGCPRWNCGTLTSNLLSIIWGGYNWEVNIMDLVATRNSGKSNLHCPSSYTSKKKTYHSPFQTIPLKIHMPIIYVKYREIGGLLLKGVAFYLDRGEEIPAQGSSTCHGRSFFVLDLRSWDSPDSGDGVLEAFLEKSWLITTLSPFKHIKCFGEDKHFKHFSNKAYKIPLYRYFGKVLNMFLMWHLGQNPRV